jgi:hypothetical protein
MCETDLEYVIVHELQFMTSPVVRRRNWWWYNTLEEQHSIAQEWTVCPTRRATNRSSTAWIGAFGTGLQIWDNFCSIEFQASQWPTFSVGSSLQAHPRVHILKRLVGQSCNRRTPNPFYGFLVQLRRPLSSTHTSSPTKMGWPQTWEQTQR